MFHVVEHLYEPRQVFIELRKKLKPGGLLLVETPNADDALLTTYDSEDFQAFTYWSHHPFLYTSQGLVEVLEDSGFRISESSQIQRYGLGNHLQWLSKGLPGGHKEWAHLTNSSIDKEYGENLAKMGKSDTLWVAATI